MLADLHAHYPMRVVEDVTPRTALDQMSKVGGRPGFGDKLRALILNGASILFNRRDWWSDYRIRPDYMRQGGVGLALSVLYRPFEEMDLGKPYAAAPASGYFAKLLEDLGPVENEVAGHDPATIRLVHNRVELDRALAEDATALVHAVEGGLLLGERTKEIEANVTTLAERGVAYVTLANLFFRQGSDECSGTSLPPERRCLPLAVSAARGRGSDRTGRGGGARDGPSARDGRHLTHEHGRDR